MYTARFFFHGGKRITDMGKTIRAVVAGATGYSGRELIRLLLNHPQIELAGAYASRTAETLPLALIHPQLLGLTQATCEPFDEAAVARLHPELISWPRPTNSRMRSCPLYLKLVRLSLTSVVPIG